MLVSLPNAGITPAVTLQSRTSSTSDRCCSNQRTAPTEALTTRDPTTNPVRGMLASATAAHAAVRPDERTAASESASRTRTCMSMESLGNRSSRTAGRSSWDKRAARSTGSVSYDDRQRELQAQLTLKGARRTRLAKGANLTSRFNVPLGE